MAQDGYHRCSFIGSQFVLSFTKSPGYKIECTVKSPVRESPSIDREGLVIPFSFIFHVLHRNAARDGRSTKSPKLSRKVMGQASVPAQSSESPTFQQMFGNDDTLDL